MAKAKPKQKFEIVMKYSGVETTVVFIGDYMSVNGRGDLCICNNTTSHESRVVGCARAGVWLTAKQLPEEETSVN